MELTFEVLDPPKDNGYQIIQRRMDQEFPETEGTRLGRLRAWFVFHGAEYQGHHETLTSAREWVAEHPKDQTGVAS